MASTLSSIRTFLSAAATLHPYFPRRRHRVLGYGIESRIEAVGLVVGRRAQHALSLAAAPACRLEAQSPVGKAFKQRAGLLADDIEHFVVGDEFDAASRGFGQQRIGGRFVVALLLRWRQPVLPRQPLQPGAFAALCQQREGGDVVDSRRDADRLRECRSLRGILAARGAHGGRAGSDEDQVRRFEGFDQRFVLRHEAVAGEYGVVAVLASDADDFGDTRLPLGAVRAGVVLDPMHCFPIPDGPQFRCPGVGVGRGVPVGKQDAVAGDPHRFEDIHRLLSHRAAADDQGLQVRAIEGGRRGGFLGPARGGTAGTHQ